MEDYIEVVKFEGKWIRVGNGGFYNAMLPTKNIHKKHKAILEAYLLDNEVQIECRFADSWLLVDRDFIESYCENNEYRLKRIIPDTNMDEPQTIKAPNSDLEYLKPEFECELLREINLKVVAEIKLDGEDYDYVTFDEDGFLTDSLDNYSYSNEIKLDRYKKPKEWYEIEDNFPCLVTDGKYFHIAYTVDVERNAIISYEWLKLNLDTHRPATKEECLSLFVGASC